MILSFSPSLNYAQPTLCDLDFVIPTYFYFQPLDAFDMSIVTTTCSSLWNGNCTSSRVPGYSLWTVCIQGKKKEKSIFRFRHLIKIGY